ncbi:MAG TPA: signal recognition particle-docking protein FtsY [Beijerinckiaceae bacterium]|nr:signal recognition particle-docking protein FtsY [Beijerinckiaceae bacterium]
MSDKDKGWFDRWFGWGESAPAAEPAKEPAAEAPAPTPASRSEGAPDYAGAAGDLAPAAPTVTQASPDLEPEKKLPAELAGADLQPVDGAPEGGGPVEPIPRSEPDLRHEPEPAAASAPEKKNWWQRLTEGMRRTSSSIGESVTSLFTKRKLDAATLEDLEDVLVQADLGVETAARISAAVGQGRYDKEIAPEEVKAILAGEVQKVLEPVAKPLAIDRAKKPYVVLMVGVNGSGKTTTIGKLAQKFRGQGLSVMLAAGDTFRAAAIDQLKVWGTRTGVPVKAGEPGADAAGLAFDALRAAKEGGTDVLLVDTAGRLQNKTALMGELEKIVRVMKKLDPEAPHAVLLVLDATVGQNALSQVELFHKAAGVTGLVMTKLDGTARGGILVALAQRFALPVHFIGVGESVEDLAPFAARDFARAIAGLERAA